MKILVLKDKIMLALTAKNKEFGLVLIDVILKEFNYETIYFFIAVYPGFHIRATN